MNPIDVTLCGVLDPAHCNGRPIGALAQLAACGGVTVLQLRDKTDNARAMLDSALVLKNALAGSAVPLIVNDRADIAHAVGADGVHLGQQDIHPSAARKVLGPSAIIGMTIRSDDEARKTDLRDVDYIGLGGVFPTASKVNETEPIGLDGVARIAGVLRARKRGIPILAIAGINAGNAAAVVGAGADGVAALSAIFAVQDPYQAAHDLRCAVDAGWPEAAQ